MNSERDPFMWNEISTDDDALKLMEAVCFFHDSCIKEMSYVSGAYVDVKAVKELASIPSKEVLVAKLAGALSGIIGGLAVALNAVAEKRENA